jgi:Flp pilus assembly protein TadD
MSWWSRLLGGKSKTELSSRRVDYLSEAIALERQGDFDAALTSYRLALRDHPNDPKILQNIAIAYSRTGRQEEAIRAYRRALEVAPELSGAHYGLAFLLLKRGDRAGAMSHLDAFLSRPAANAEMERWVRHAQQTLDALRSGTDVPSEPTAPPRS